MRSNHKFYSLKMYIELGAQFLRQVQAEVRVSAWINGPSEQVSPGIHGQNEGNQHSAVEFGGEGIG